MGRFEKIRKTVGRWLRSYGKFRPSPTVGEMFNSGQVMPELLYYRIGSEEAPRAIIALERSLVLQSRLWKPLLLDADGLASRVKRMAFHAIDGQGPTGWRILDPSGEVIGIAYSPRPSVVQVKDGGQVVVHLPDEPRPAR